MIQRLIQHIWRDGTYGIFVNLKVLILISSCANTTNRS